MTTRKPGQKRTRTRREHDRQEIARLRLHEYSQLEIAKTLGISLSTVKRELNHLHREWQAESQADTDEALSLELRRLEAVSREAWKGWELSLKEQTTTTEEGDSRKTRTATTSGDPRYLNTLLSAIERRCRILGIDAASKVASTTPDGDEAASGIFVVPAPAASVEEWLTQVQNYQDAKEAESKAH